MNNPFVQEQAAGLARRLIAGLGRFDAADRDGLSTGLVAAAHDATNAIAPSSFCEWLSAALASAGAPAAVSRAGSLDQPGEGHADGQ